MSVAGDNERSGERDEAQALQARVMELEIKASYTDDLLEQLNLTIYRQQQQIDRLLDELRDLRRRVPEGGPAGGATHLRDELPRTIECAGLHANAQARPCLGIFSFKRLVGHVLHLAQEQAQEKARHDQDEDDDAQAHQPVVGGKEIDHQLHKSSCGL